MADKKIRQSYLGIGSNLGERGRNINTAVGMIGEKTGRVLISSSVYETEPWGFNSENKFLNIVIKLETKLVPSDLLDALLEIEKSMGRVRDKKQFSSRVIDIDILFYEDLVITYHNLKIPHPHIQERKFVLMPLVEIAPDFVHPVFRKSVKALLDTCIDDSAVRIIT
jgi:2-amino-4-hydroxy-6-hydroxymethyldihydropteridine diphosphokinase